MTWVMPPLFPQIQPTPKVEGDMSIITPEDEAFNYLVISTGYENRFEPVFQPGEDDEDDDDIDDNGVSERKEKFLQRLKRMPHVKYLGVIPKYDNGRISVSKDLAYEPTEALLSQIREITTGVVFRCSSGVAAMRIYMWLQKVEYCGCMDALFDISVKSNADNSVRCLVLDIDCESG